MVSSLKDALRIVDFPRIAFTGAGGKTTALFQLSREFSSPVVIATTTHFGVWQIELADKHITAMSLRLLKENLSRAHKD